MEINGQVKKILSEAGPQIDQADREVIPPRKPSGQVLASVKKSDRINEYPSEGLTPAILASIFKEADSGNVKRQMELFSAMEEKDLHLASVLQTRKLAVTGLDWSLEWDPNEENPPDDILHYCVDMLKGIVGFEDNLLDILDAIGKGYSAQEMKWIVRDGDNVLQDIIWINPKNAIFYDVNSSGPDTITYEYPRLLTSSTDMVGITPDPYKLIYHRHKTRSGYDTRAGILRVAAWMYLFRNYTLKDWAVFSEVYGMPLRKGVYKDGASADEKEELYAMVRNLASDTGCVISEHTAIEFIEAAKNSSIDVYEKFYSLGGREISKAVLGQTSSTDSTSNDAGDVQGGVKDRAQVRQDLLLSDIRQLQNTIHYQPLKAIVGFNFGWDKPVPWLKFKVRVKEDIVALSTVYKNAIEASLPVAEDDMYQRLGIRKPLDGEKVIKKAASPTFSFGMPSQSQQDIAAQSERLAQVALKLGMDETQIQHLVGFAVNQAGALIKKLSEPLRQLVESGGSLEQIKAEMLKAYPHMDSRKLQLLIHETMLAARLYGMMRVQKEQE